MYNMRNVEVDCEYDENKGRDYMKAFLIAPFAVAIVWAFITFGTLALQSEAEYKALNYPSIDLAQ